MLDLWFVAVPNIEGIRFLWYLKVIVMILVFGFSLFFLLLFVIRYRRASMLLQQTEEYSYHTSLLEQQLFAQKIFASTGKKKVLLFIDYLERFVTIWPYANIFELFCRQGFSKKEAKELCEVIYTNILLSPALEDKITKMLTKLA